MKIKFDWYRTVNEEWICDLPFGVEICVSGDENRYRWKLWRWRETIISMSSGFTTCEAAQKNAEIAVIEEMGRFYGVDVDKVV